MARILIGNWWALALRGVVAILFALIAFIKPGIAAEVVILLFGAYALLDGIFALVAALRAAQHHGRSGGLLLEGILNIVIAIIVFVWPGPALVALIYLIAIWAIVTGVALVAASIAVAARASASGAALLACALVHRGLPAGLALPFLALGAVPFRRASAVRSFLVAVPAVAGALAVGAALQRLPLLRGAARTAASVLARAKDPVAVQLAAAPVATACAAFLVALALALALRSGVRGWFAPFRHADGHDHEEHGHEHAPAGAR